MAGLFGKLVAHFLNEVIVKTLANSRTFQRFALRTDTFIQTQKTTAAQLKDQAVKNAREKVTAKAETGGLEAGGIDWGKFFIEFRDEISGKGPNGGGTSKNKPTINTGTK